MTTGQEAVKIDAIDLRILQILQATGRITNQELAEKAGLSPSPCLQRTRRLEQAGVIEGYGARIQIGKVCRHIDVIATITLHRHSPEDFQAFDALIGRMNHVVECHKVSGNVDYFIRFICPDLHSYHMLSDQLLKLSPHIAHLASHVILKTVKSFQGVNLDNLV